MDEKKKKQEVKKEEPVVPFQPDVDQALVAANYIIERLKLPELSPQEIHIMQKQM